MTSRYLYGEEKRVLPWMEGIIPHMRFHSDAQAIAHERDGKLVGAAGYDHFTSRSCSMHVASDSTRQWLTREFLVRVYAYPFIQCGFARVTSIVSVNNEKSLRFIRHLGYTEEGRMREEGDDGDDMILFGLLRRECRYLAHWPLAA